jgi:predicted metalloprotease with PDZ domain
LPHSAAPSDPRPVHYRIVALDPHAHLYEVQVTVPAPDPAGQRFRLPTWVPGSYLIREFARQFISARADCDGTEVTLQKSAKDTWEAAPCVGPLTVTAQVYAYDLSVRTAYLDAHRGYFNGAAMLLYAHGLESAPCTIDLVQPSGAAYAKWRVATTLQADDAASNGFGRYRAANYDELIDHPVETGEFALATFKAADVPHDIAVSGRHGADMQRLCSDLAQVCQWHIELFGDAPFRRYLFQVMAVGDGYGGLEHRDSTSLICRREELPQRGMEDINDDYLKFLGLASHEYFHAWNVKRIKPAAFVPYDLSREGYTRQLWAFEGITSYYDDLALVRCGLIGAERYLGLLGQAVTSVLRTPGRLTQSVADSSFDAWIKFYRADENTPNAVVSYYAKGALVAWALDLTLRRDGRTSLDALMRALWTRYGKPGTGVPEDGIPRLASELAGHDLSAFFARYVHGTEDPPLRELLADFGVLFELRPPLDANDRGGKPGERDPQRCTFGARVAADGKLTHVFVDGPAGRAGLSAGDTLVAVDGLKASTERLAALLARGTPGDAVEVHAFRRDELDRYTVTLQPAAADTCYLVLDPNCSAKAKARRDAWLCGPP